MSTENESWRKAFASEGNGGGERPRRPRQSRPERHENSRQGKRYDRQGQGHERQGQSYSRQGQSGTYKRRPRTADYNPHAKYSLKQQIEYKENHFDPNEPILLNHFLARAGV